ncbi:helix-turn-helix domain-containing protein [Sinomicrobium sp.]
MKANKTNNLSVDTPPPNYTTSEEGPDVERILENLKRELGIKTNKELSILLEVRANTISTWKKRNSLDYARLIELSSKYNIDLNQLFLNRNLESDDLQEVITVPKELQYQYVTKWNNELFLKDLPRYRFPFHFRPGSRAFQAVDMVYPADFKGIAYAVGTPVESIDEIVFGKLHVLVSSERGIFVGRVEKNMQYARTVNVITNENKVMLSEISMPEREIIEIWKVSNIILQDFLD